MGHFLKLTDNLVWEFVPMTGTENLTKKLSTLMGLSKDHIDISRKIIFISSDHMGKLPPEFTMEGNSELSYLPCDGWSAIKLKDVCLWRHEQVPDFLCEISTSRGKILDMRRLYQSLYPLYTGVIMAGGSPAHAALFNYKGKGVLIAGTSGMGKSTCCRRVEAPWKAICDDEALVLRTADGYQVHPFPTWNDYIARRSTKTWDVQLHLPLTAIFFLKHASVDRVEPVKKGMAAYSFYRSSLQIFDRYKPYICSDEHMSLNKQLFENACRISGNVPSYVLHASLRGRFWEEMEKVL